MVRGLAWRWRASRSVKNACRVGAIKVMIGPPSGCLAAGSGQGEQFRGRRQVPVGAGRLAVTQIGRQRRDLRLDVFPGAIPAQQGPDGKGVSELVDSWPVRSVEADAGGSTRPERRADDSVDQAPGGEGDEERRVLGLGHQLIAQRVVLPQRVHDAGVQRDQPGLAELGLADQQHALGPVDVVAVELDRLADAKAASGEQPDQRVVGRRPQRRRMVSSPRP